jgi:enoyl-CoA hydratase
MHFHAWLLGMRTAMEMMLTGDSLTGIECVEQGWANRAFPVEELDHQVLAVAERIAKMPPDMVQLNKRVVHRGMETMGLRTAIRAGTELCALGTHQRSMRAFIENMQRKGLTAALTERDEGFGDYRTATDQPKEAPAP